MNFIIALSFLFYSCALKAGDKNKIPVGDFPDISPSDLEITYSENGGMLNISERLFISKDSCFYEKNKYGNIARVDFNLSDSSLDSVYDAIRENKFDEIEIYSEKVYDREEAVYR